MLATEVWRRFGRKTWSYAFLSGGILADSICKISANQLANRSMAEKLWEKGPTVAKVRQLDLDTERAMGYN